MFGAYGGRIAIWMCPARLSSYSRTRRLRCAFKPSQMTSSGRLKWALSALRKSTISSLLMLRALAVTSKTRVPSMPDVPTVAESGIPGFGLLSWYGVWGPANLPTAVTERLNAEISRAVEAPSLKAKFAELSFIPTKSNPEQFRKLIRDDLSKIGKAVKDAKIQIDF